MTWRSIHMKASGHIVIDISVAGGAFSVGIRGRVMHWFRTGAEASLCGRATRSRMREIDNHCFALHTTPCSSCLAHIGRAE